MIANNQHAYEHKLGKVRRILVESLAVEVEHLPIERYGPNLNIVGIEKAVEVIMAEFGFNKPREHEVKGGSGSDG